MMQVNSESLTTHVSLADTEQCTGLSREVLRMWELRYQFPLPQRGPRGQRMYLEADVGKPKLIARLLNKVQRAARRRTRPTWQAASCLPTRHWQCSAG